MAEHRWAAIGAVAAAVSACVALAAYLWPHSAAIETGHTTGQPRPPAAAVASTGAPAGPVSSAPATGVQPDRVRWQGRLTITSPTGVVLDPMPPHQAGDVGIGDIDINVIHPDTLSGGGVNDTINTAVWPGPGAPTRKGCSDQIDTNPSYDITAPPGRVICVRTEAGRIAAVTVVSFAGDYGPCVVDVTVWELA